MANSKVCHRRQRRLRALGERMRSDERKLLAANCLEGKSSQLCARIGQDYRKTVGMVRKAERAYAQSGCATPQRKERDFLNYINRERRKGTWVDYRDPANYWD